MKKMRDIGVKHFVIPALTLPPELSVTWKLSLISVAYITELYKPGGGGSHLRSYHFVDRGTV
ncbi:mCG1027454 [Mus musculus]|jgi:hypothetical protein|nr:mCG1027454 [Mus musculus]